MTDLLEKAVEAARQKPAAEQNDIAAAMLSLMHLGEPLLGIEPEHRESVMTGMAQIARGEVAQGTPAEIIARVFARARSRA